MTAKEFEGTITNEYLKELRLNRREYEWYDTGGLIMNYGDTMIYLPFKIINVYARIGVSNLKYEIEKATIAKFGNNVKYIIYDMYSNNYIITDKGEHHYYYVGHIFRDLLLGGKSTFNCFNENTNYD